MLEKIKLHAPEIEEDDDLRRIRLLEFLHQNNRFIWKDHEIEHYVARTQTYMREIKSTVESGMFLEIHNISNTVDYYFPTYGNGPLPTLMDMNKMLENRITLNLQDKLSPDLRAICNRALSEMITRKVPDGVPFLLASKKSFSQLHVIYDLDCSGIGVMKGGLKHQTKMSLLYGFLLFGLTTPKFGRRIGAGVGLSFFGIYLTFVKVYDLMQKRAIKTRKNYISEAVKYLTKLTPTIVQSCLAQFSMKMDEDWNMNNQYLTAQANQIIRKN
ncbi:unnamed protein product [Diamesa tonsa]